MDRYRCTIQKYTMSDGHSHYSPKIWQYYMDTTGNLIPNSGVGGFNVEAFPTNASGIPAGIFVNVQVFVTDSSNFAADPGITHL